MVMQVQLHKVIDEANQSLDAGLGKTYQPTTPTLQDGQVLDTFPNALDPKNYTVDGPVKLTYGDIKSPQGLNAWISSNSISVGGRMINHPQFDFCAVMQTIHNKAKWHLSRATDDNQKSMFNLYVQQVEKIAPSIAGPDGKACSLSGVTSPSAGEGAGKSDINQVMGALPLRPTDIDFNRITDFFNLYKPLLGDRGASAISAMDKVTESMNTAKGLTESGNMDNFPLSANIQQIGTWLGGNKGQTEALGLIAQLKYIVSGTAAVISHLKNGQGQQLNQSAIDAQVGNQANDQGFAGNNLNHLQVWENQARSQNAAYNAGPPKQDDPKTRGL